MVAAVKPWNIQTYNRRRPRWVGDWHLVAERSALSEEFVQKQQPRYIFFPHWSWLVPNSILGLAECVLFHMTDVPYGRGGTPLQNLIERGHRDTVVSALRMSEDIDAGPVYLKRPLSLAGSAQAIYERMSELAFDMIEEIVATEPTPAPQSGAAVYFDRRRPDMSELPTTAPLSRVYDHIRMLDAETYPRAFLASGALTMEFSGAIFDAEEGSVRASVIIRRKPNSGD